VNGKSFSEGLFPKGGVIQRPMSGGPGRGVKQNLWVGPGGSIEGEGGNESTSERLPERRKRNVKIATVWV